MSMRFIIENYLKTLITRHQNGFCSFRESHLFGYMGLPYYVGIIQFSRVVVTSTGLVELYTYIAKFGIVE